MDISDKSKQYLLSLARDAVERGMRPDNADYGKIPDEVTVARGIFVTIKKNGDLRGCIGNIIPGRPLHEAVVSNAKSAAYEDPRFPPLSDEEFDQIEIEISILTEPVEMDYSSPQDLLQRLGEARPGVVLEAGDNRATFLPQVWEEIADPEEFISSLCLKAGLFADYWREESHSLVVKTYLAIKFKESDFD